MSLAAFPLQKKKEKKIEEATKEDEDDVPNLVGENFEEVSKKTD